MSAMHVAQFNVVRFKFPPGHVALRTFEENVARINAIAEASPGFVWRYVEAGTRDVEFVQFVDGSFLGALSVWESIEALKAFVYGKAHLEMMRRKAEWMSNMAERSYVLWHVERGIQPRPEEGWKRLVHFRENSDSAMSFSFGPRER